jgi:hypothetical protein
MRPIGRSRNVVRMLAARLVPNIETAVTAANFAGGVMLTPMLKANAIIGLYVKLCRATQTFKPSSLVPPLHPTDRIPQYIYDPPIHELNALRRTLRGIILLMQLPPTHWRCPLIIFVGTRSTSAMSLC